jgi:hypothetical protein
MKVRMVAIKDMEMPKDCKKCPLMGTDGKPKDLLNPMMCVAIWATTHEIKHCVEGKILDDCPLVEIEERDVAIKSMDKLEKIEQIINDWKNGDLESQDTIGAFHIIKEILERDN